MDKNNVERRMRELMMPVDQQIMMCDNQEDLLMMACAMLQRVNEILDSSIGIEGRKKIVGGSLND
jgi:hypothetical protein